MSIETKVKCIILSGVSGCGKSTVSKSLLGSLGPPWIFIEGDDYHSENNVEKMSTGEPLTDSDRLPWLSSISSVIRYEIANGRLPAHRRAITSCSALKKEYRQILVKESDLDIEQREILVFFLRVPKTILRERLDTRCEHFFNSKLLSSQLEIVDIGEHSESYLEILDGEKSVNEIVDSIRELIE